MPTINPDVLINLIEQIEPYVATDKFTINEWKSYTGVHVSPNNIELDGKDAVTMRLGDRWRAGYDDTRYFEADVVIPDFLADKKVYLTIDFGGEAIVRINDEIVGAVSSKESEADSGWGCRTEIIFKEKFKGGEKLHIQVENAINCGVFCDEAMAGHKDTEYQMRWAGFTAVDELAESYWYDISTALDIYNATEDEYVKSRLYIAIDESAHKIDYDMGEEAFLKSVPEAKETFWKKIDEIKSQTPGEVIMAGHSHLDVAWLWTVLEINRKTARTFSNNIALMNNYPDFKFTQSQAVLYDFIKQHYPEIYEQVKEKVKNGQWEIVGNAWVEADTNIASGEALVRQLLYGREFFLKEFGVSSDIYWLPDCFGFTWALPQIIKRSGMKYFVTSKLYWNDTNEFPYSVFKWKSHSGDEILAYLQKQPYQGEFNAPYVINTRHNNRQNNIVDTSFGMFGYGDGGGGCTFQMLEKGSRLKKLPGVPKTRNSTAKEFFSKIEKFSDSLPVWDGEMYYENHRGTFTSQAFVKKNNRRGEYLMRNAEILNVLCGGEYPYETIEKAWKLLLINQFHDILPGTSIHEVFENCREEYKEMKKLGKSVVRSAFTQLNSTINAPENAIVVWNLTNWEQSGVVKAEIPFGAKYITDSKGNIMPSSLTEKDGRYFIEFYAENVPALGYGVYCFSEGSDLFKRVNARKDLLENEYLKVVIDENGLLDSVTDKETGRQILTGKGNLLTISHDKPIHESAWNMEFDYQMKQWELIEADSIEVIESSALRGVIEVVRHFNKSTITQKYILEKDKRTLDFETTVDWHEREKVLKAAFPVNIRSRTASCEIAHGSAEYPTHRNTSYDLAKFEFCAHKWADLSEGGYGVSILNDCKYGYNVYTNVMKITLMRGPICPDPTGDIGISTFRYSFYPHAGTWREADTVKLGFAENIPLKASFFNGNGKAAEDRSFINLNCPNIVLDAVKPAQDGNGIIVRVYEAETRHSEVKLSIDLDYNKVIECNLMETDEQEVPCNDKEFSFSIKPHEVKTFRLIKE